MMDEIQVLFDRRDRLYRFGEEVTGRVAIKADADFTCTGVELRCAWRTHGKGDRDSGRVERFVLAEGDMVLRAGECREFPFRFQAPMGPVTYHGSKLNVDWYLAASASRRLRSDLKCEEDFLLMGGEPTGPIVLGDKEAALGGLPQGPLSRLAAQDPQDADTGGWEQKSEGPGIPGILLGLWFSSIVAALIFMAQDADLARFLGALAILLTIVLLAIVITQNAYKRKLEIREMCVEPDIVFPGSQVTCRVAFLAKRDLYLVSILASICAVELVTFSRGTASETEVTVGHKKDLVKTFQEQLSSGRPITFDCTLPVPPDAPARFSSAHNSLQWTVDLNINLKGWPGLTRHFPITVLPAGCAPWR